MKKKTRGSENTRQRLGFVFERGLVGAEVEGMGSRNKLFPGKFTRVGSALRILAKQSALH